MVLPRIKFYSIGHLVKPLFHTSCVNSINYCVLFLYSLQHIMLHFPLDLPPAHTRTPDTAVDYLLILSTKLVYCTDNAEQFRLPVYIFSPFRKG